MKRLGEPRIEKDESQETKKETKKLKKKPQPQENKGPKNFLEKVMDREEAIQKKIEMVEGKILGFKVNKLDVGEITDVWVPYCVFKYDYHIAKTSNIIKGGHRTGTVYIIYDLNEEHCFQYDQVETGELPIVRGSVPVREGEKVIPYKKSDKELDEEVRDFIQRKIMFKTFGHSADLTLKEQTVFYRPAVEIEIFFKGMNRNLRYAYLDDYAVKNEHILGMKYRLKN